MNSLLHIAQWRKEITLLLLGVLAMVFFEASQQYYYVVQFKLVEPSKISFGSVLQGQAWRWLFWIACAIPLSVFVTKRPMTKREFSIKEIAKYLGIISFALLLNILIITFFQFLMNGEMFTFSAFAEYFTFFTFQKSPIYFIAFIGLVIAIHFMLSTEAMELKMKELSAIKEKQYQLYEELKSRSYADSASIIEVKTGTRVKYVPVDTICWIEADDYCVKLHDVQDQTYTLRTSLKAMEKELPNSFVRVHRKAIVNLEHVKELILSDQSRLLLSNNIEVPVAQSRLKEVKETMLGSFALNTV